MHFISFKLFLWPTLPFCNYYFLHVKIGGWESRISAASSGNVRPNAFQNADWCQDSSTPTTFLISIFFAVETKQEFLSKLSHNWVPKFSAVVLPYFLLQPGSHTWANYYYHSLPRLRTQKVTILKKMYQKKYQIPGMFRLSRHFTEHLLRFLALPVTVQSSQHSLSHVFTVRSSNLRKDFGCSACYSKPVAAAGA